MKNKKASFEKFIALARRGLKEGDLAAAPGFATRVAGRWAGGPRELGWLALWERALSWGVTATMVVCLLTAWFCRADFGAATHAADTLAEFAGLGDDGDDVP